MHIGEILKKVNISLFWDKVRNIIKKGFDSVPVYNDKYLKTKIESSEEKINTKLHNNRMSKEGFQCICQSVALIDSVFKMGKNYYPHVFLEKFKTVLKKKKWPYILLRALNFLMRLENKDYKYYKYYKI